MLMPWISRCNFVTFIFTTDNFFRSIFIFFVTLRNMMDYSFSGTISNLCLACKNASITLYIPSDSAF